MSESNDNEVKDTEVKPAPAKELSSTTDAGPHTLAPETSQQRMIKYGANVVLASVLVIVLGGILIWLGERYDYRKDATGSDSYSLKPQTIAIIKELDQPVKLVSLYPRLKQDPKDKNAQQDYYQPIVDILDEYKRNGKNIEVEAIDPVAEPVKVDTWLGEVTRKYGGNVTAYRDLLKAFPKTLEEIQKLATSETEKMRAIPRPALESIQDEDLADALNGAFSTVLIFPVFLKQIDAAIQKELGEKLPNYKAATTELEGQLRQFSRQTEAVRKAMEEVTKNPKAPKELQTYATESTERFGKMKGLADEVLKKIEGLGELKVNEVYQKLATPEGEQPAPAIAVMGQNDIQLIDVGDLWKSGESTGLTRSASEQGPPKLRFTGEQRVTAAILSLTRPEKQLVVFVRSGGEAKIGGGMMGPGGYSDIAERLKAYNFLVKEKDLSGQSAAMAARSGMPPGEEATDDELEKAIWVVFSEPQSHPQFGRMPGADDGQLAMRLKAHLDAGGSAICLFDLEGSNLAPALKDWGIEVKTNTVIVHEPIPSEAGSGEDFIETARREPFIFVLNQFGGPHAIADTIQSLDVALVPMFPVAKVAGAEGATVTQLLPVPPQVPTWGETDTSFLFSRRRGEDPVFDSGKDMTGPLFAGAAAERKDKGRLVVIGSASFIHNNMLSIPDPKLSRNNMTVVRFPGNAELFMNSIFWLAKQEKMIALSPAAMETARIKPISSGMLAFWRIGVLLIGLPALALAGGLFVYRARTKEG